MQLPSLFRTLDDALRAFWLTLAIAVCQAFALIILVGVVATRHERIVLLPPYVDKEMSLGWATANADYLKSIGFYFVTMANSVTPANVEFVKKAVGSVVDATIYPAIRKRFEATAAEPAFKSYGHVQPFEATLVQYEPETSKVFVCGDANTGGQNHLAGVTYEMVIVMRNGRPWILSVETYDGTTPHTLKWHADHPPVPEKKDGDK